MAKDFMVIPPRYHVLTIAHLDAGSFRCLGVSLLVCVVLIYSAWDTLEPWEFLDTDF